MVGTFLSVVSTSWFRGGDNVYGKLCWLVKLRSKYKLTLITTQGGKISAKANMAAT